MLKVAIVSGGYTDESVISFKSADLIYNELDSDLYEKYKVRILPNHWYVDLDNQKIPINKADFSFTYNNNHIKFDVVYNIIHGTPGEDGLLQAYWQTIGIPFTGCDFYASALTFNKKDCIAVLNKYNVPHATSVYLSKNQPYKQDDIINKVGLPCFVKPNRSGSSLGISKVKQANELEAAIDFAYQQDDEILIESFLDGTEVSVGVIRYQNQIKVLGITEIVSETEFFDYAAKYQGKSQEITPARITQEEQSQVEEVAKQVFHILNLKGFTRAEYIIVNGVPHFLEVNTVPGMSPQSILPQQARQAGIPITELLTEAIQSAINQTSKI